MVFTGINGVNLMYDEDYRETDYSELYYDLNFELEEKIKEHIIEDNKLMQYIKELDELNE